MIKHYITFIIILGLFISAVFGILYFIKSVIYDKPDKKDSRIEPGDVILKKEYFENPFNDYEWMYETVTEVRTNSSGRLYFKSYTSDRNGVKSPEQNMFKQEHSDGKRYRSDDWEKVNHIKL